MKKFTAIATLLVASLIIAAPAHADWWLNYEATFFQFSRSDGVRVGETATAEDVDFDFKFTPRVEVGFVSYEGLGIRARWWEFDHDQLANEGVSFLAVSTLNIDLELFEEFAINDFTSIELSLGVRYNEFDELMFDNDGAGEFRRNRSTGVGGIVGVELRRDLWKGNVYARARGAIIVDDKTRLNDLNGLENLTDSSQGMVELGLGYEFAYTLPNGALLTFRGGAEWQNWYNYSSNFEDPALSGEDVFVGSSDVGFFGFVGGMSLIY